MTKEVFSKPCVGAIIEKNVDGVACILLQTRQKEDDAPNNGLTEIPAGKVREHENLFDALRREVWEETGLTVTRIVGEEKSEKAATSVGATQTINPFCVTQNLTGGYGIVLCTFVCQAAGAPVASTNETVNIRYVPVSQVRKMLEETPESFFFMHLCALRKYLS